jgi:hypothetical protein
MYFYLGMSLLILVLVTAMFSTTITGTHGVRHRAVESLPKSRDVFANPRVPLSYA